VIWKATVLSILQKHNSPLKKEKAESPFRQTQSYLSTTVLLKKDLQILHWTIHESSENWWILTHAGKKVGKTLRTCTGVLRRLQSHFGEARLPVVSRVYEKLLRNTTSELFQSTFHNYTICTTVLKVWHITQIQLIQAVTLCSLASASSYSASNFSRSFREIEVHGKTAVSLGLADLCMQCFTWQHWLKAIFNFCTISTLYTHLLSS